jgi:hypothetical protein
MSDVVIFSAGGDTEYRRSVHTPTYLGQPGVLINPDVRDLLDRNVSPRDWQRVGDAVIEKTNAEKAQAQARRLQALRDRVEIDAQVDVLIGVLAPKLDPPITAAELHAETKTALKARL